jgi:hypothetical protein
MILSLLNIFLFVFCNAVYCLITAFSCCRTVLVAMYRCTAADMEWHQLASNLSNMFLDVNVAFGCSSWHHVYFSERHQAAWKRSISQSGDGIVKRGSKLNIGPWMVFSIKRPLIGDFWRSSFLFKSYIKRDLNYLVVLIV